MPKWDLWAALYWMQIGETFFIPCINTPEIRKQAKDMAKEVGVHIVTRTVVEDGIKGVRVWKVDEHGRNWATIKSN